MFATAPTQVLVTQELGAIPMFLLMGSFAAAAGLSSDLYRLFYALLGHYRGGLAMTTVAGCGGCGAICGSSLATAIFFSVAFAAAFTFLEPGNDVSWANEAVPLLGMGPLLPLWVSLGVADWLVKLTLALLALIPFRVVVRKLTARPA